MRTLTAAINIAADGKFHKTMQGDMMPMASLGEVRMIAYIFEMEIDLVFDMVDARAVELMQEFRAKQAAQTARMDAILKED